MKSFQCLTISTLLLAVGFALGIGWSHSPIGYPGTFAPPAPQSQSLLNVDFGKLDESDQWIKNYKIYLSPLVGIKGNRHYSILILAPQSRLANAGVSGRVTFYLLSKSLDTVQPISIMPDDFILGNNSIIIKLLDEGPNSNGYYSTAKELIISSYYR